MDSLRQFFRTPAGRITAVALCALAVVLMGWSAYSTLGPSSALSASRDRTYVCAETGKPFKHTVKVGDKTPVYSPHSGKNTGYPAELCFWNADGTTKSEPTPVLLNEYAGKSGPTFCPDCRRLVVGLNPPPQAGAKPPLTETEYKSRKERR